MVFQNIPHYEAFFTPCKNKQIPRIQGSACKKCRIETRLIKGKCKPCYMREYHTKEKEWLKVCIQCGRKQRNGKNEKAYIPAKDRENCFRCNTCATRWSRQHN
ncbi:uncharacterized protein [Bemisia tabaci]|uniref:uncharacterized protein n=1 Tax=Bemisia tabaci TaxID=7038 RepID=UPI003B27B4F8